MREFIKLSLISLWLFLSFQFNVLILKLLIQYAFWQIAHLYAGLDRFIWLQNLLAILFIAWVVVLLLWRNKLGRTLALVLLLSSSCEMLGFLLCSAAYALFGGSYAFGADSKVLMIAAATISINLICLLALRKRI